MRFPRQTLRIGVVLSLWVAAPSAEAKDDTAGGESLFVSTAPDSGYANAAPVGCFPDCRTGFLCRAGQCVSRCNPTCVNHQKCTDAGNCVDGDDMAVVNPVSVNPVVTPTDSVMSGLLEAHRKNYELRQLRLAYRKKQRLTILASAAFDATGDVVVMGGGFQLGLVNYLTRNFSYRLRFGLFAGGVSCQLASCGEANGALVMTAKEDIGFIFGPFGRFYLGPAVGVQGVFVPTAIQYIEYDGRPGRLDSHVMVGLGGEMGLVFGRYEHMDLNVKGFVNPANTAEVSLIVGVGFHLFPWDKSGEFDLLRWK
ncbi:MAG: hypothetical protein JXX14_26425 [Deltaproteobacteria bacterium]|nr:hypothetical protein [Deltaproteobacteria bacterium]